MSFHYFDIVIGVVVLLLGLKGIFNGFFKELFGLIGIIGGVFLASRFGSVVGEMVNNTIFHFENQSAVTFTGFLLTLGLFWGVMVMLGILFKKLSHASGLGPIDKFMGFVVGSGKFFLIAAVIIFALNNIKAIQSNFAPLMQNSLLYPVLVEVGDIIMHIDPTEASAQISEGVEEGIQKASDAAGEAIQAKAKALLEPNDVNMTALSQPSKSDQ
ncbi:MAG: CvpA family protein [Campylobacterales bacterium]|nr:CvpA family protein [Campylobacterales bacterium]